MSKNDLVTWQNRVNETLRVRRERMKDYQACADLFRGDMMAVKRMPVTARGDRIWTHLAYSTIRSKAAALFVRYPQVVVTPKKKVGIETALLVQELANWAWRELKLKSLIKNVVLLESLVFGTSWVKFGWEPESLHGVWVAPIAPWHVHYSIDITSFDELDWIIFESRRTKEEIEELYGGKVLERAEARPLSSPFAESVEFDAVRKRELIPDISKHVEKLSVFEVHDRKNGTVGLFLENSSRWLRAPQESMYIDLEQFFPCLPLIINPDVQSFEGQSEAMKLLLHEEALQRIRTYQIRHLARFNRKYKTRPGNITQKGEIALKSGEDGAVVEMNNPDLFAAISDAPISQDVYMVERLIKTDAREVTGMPDYRRAGTPAHLETASEVVAIERAADARAISDIDQLETFCADLSRNIIQLFQLFATRERVVPIIEGDLVRQWRTWSRRDIAGEFDFHIQHGSTTMADERLMRAFAKELWMAMRDEPNINRQELLRWLLRTYQVPQAEHILQPPLPPPAPPADEIPFAEIPAEGVEDADLRVPVSPLLEAL